MDKSQVQNEYLALESTLKTHLENLEKIILESGNPLEGNSFYMHNTLNKYPQLFAKQMNTFWCGTTAKTRICEIGFNAGHSTLLLLLGRDTSPLDFTVFDIGHHAYTKPCLEYMKAAFPHVTFEYIEGDSTLTLPLWNVSNATRMETYDVVHVDGGHTEHCIKNDMKNASKLVAPGGIMIVDDTNVPYINNYVNLYLALGDFQEIDVNPTEGYPHRILRKVKV